MKDCLQQEIKPGVIAAVYSDHLGMQPVVVTKVGNAMISYTVLKVEERGSGKNILDFFKIQEKHVSTTVGITKIAVITNAEKHWSFSYELNEILFKLSGAA